MLDGLPARRSQKRHGGRPEMRHMQLKQQLSDGVFPNLRGLHQALLPLLDQIRVVPAAFPDFGPAVYCDAPGSLAVAPGLPATRGGAAMLRYGLELAWLTGVPNLSPAAASVLAAHTAACFARLLPPDRTETNGLAATFDSLTGPCPDPAALAELATSLAGTHPGTATLSMDDLARIAALWPLSEPTDQLLTFGGDDRLALDPATGLNRYGCAPWPRPAVITFGSCTASSLSPAAFAATETARQALIADALGGSAATALEHASAAIGTALLRYFQAEDLADTILAASGTDAALVVTGLLAAERPSETLTSILMSPSETGSGVPDAVQGRHFAPLAPTGRPVGKGEPIDGLPASLHLETIPLRDETGQPRPAEDIDAACHAAVRRGLARGRVVLHAIEGSKTGLTAPDRAACSRLVQAYGPALDIVIDACQARIEPALARWYLQQGFPILVTGSKFFAAPGFCGAVLFPRARLQRIAQHGRLPAGLESYASLQGGFGSRRCPGLVLRWQAALHEMAAFTRLDTCEVRHRLGGLGATVRELLSQDSRLRLVAAPRPAGMGWSDLRSVFTFAVRGPDGWMNPLQLRRLYAELNDDLSAAFAGAGQEPGLAAQRCQIGQPVELGHSSLGGLRIALSSTQITQTRDERTNLGTVLSKLRMLLDRSVPGAGSIAAATS
jgi:hypothetical protein